jgi:broad specificity phosphatase PhoE
LRLLSSDPGKPAPLTPRGELQARRLGAQIRGLAVELCLHSRFERTRQTALLALGGREVRTRTEPRFDEIDAGLFDGRSIDEYHAWRFAHGIATPFPGGESIFAALNRFADGLDALLESRARTVLVITHEIVLRHVIEAATDNPVTSGIPMATPYLFDEVALARAAFRLRPSAESDSLAV